MSTEQYKFHFAGYILDPGSRQLFSPEGELVSLSSRAFDTLLVLVERRGETLSKSQLIQVVWPGVVVEENNLNQAISSIRRALGDNRSRNRFIQTIPGRGYCFVAETEMVSVNCEADEAEPENASTDTDDQVDSATPNPGGEEVAHAAHGVVEKNATRRPVGKRNTARSTGLIAGAGVLAILTVALLAVAVQWLWFPGEPESAGSDTGTVREITAIPEVVDDVSSIENSIAVLPFTSSDSAAEGDDGLFAIGLQDEIINQLTKIDSLNVISRNSVQTILERGHDIRELGEMLRVESVLTGNILYLEDRARVSLEMVDPSTGVMLWSDSYDTETDNLDELVSVQSNIALSAARALEAEVDQQERQALSSIPTRSFAAYRYNIAARNAYFKQDFESAWMLSRQALALDPEYYDALYHYASVNTVLIGVPLEGMSTRGHYRMALEAAEAMTRLEADRTEGHALKAAIFSTNKEWGRVAEEIDILQSIDASLSDMRFLASVLMVLGDFQGAIEIFEANLEVEPVNFYARGFLMMAHELAGNRMQARQEYELGEELSREWWGDTVNIFLALGRGEHLQDIAELPDISEEAQQALQALNAGNLDNVRTAVQSYLKSQDRAPSESLYFAAMTAYLGDPQQALTLASESVREVWLNIHWLWLPVFDEMRTLPGFRDLMVESGLVAYWQKNGWPEMCGLEGDAFTCDWSAYPSAGAALDVR